MLSIWNGNIQQNWMIDSDRFQEYAHLHKWEGFLREKSQLSLPQIFSFQIWNCSVFILIKVICLKDLRRKVFKSLTCSYSGTSRNTKDFQQFHLIDPIQMGWPHLNIFNNTLQCNIIQYHSNSWSLVNSSSEVIGLCSDEINVCEKNTSHDQDHSREAQQPQEREALWTFETLWTLLILKL